MPDAVVIGKVAVKVIPDTADFRKKAETDLDAIEKRLEIKVKLIPDEDELKRKVEATMKRIEGQLSSLKIKVNLGDEGDLRAAIARLEAELKKLDAVDIEVDLDRGSIEKKLAELRGELAKVERLKLSIDPKSETSMQAALARIKAELAKKTELKVQIKMDTASLNAAARDLERRLADAGRVKVEADNAKLRDTLRRVDNAFSALSINIRPDIDSEELRRTTGEIKRSLEKIDDLSLTITPEMSDRERREVEHQIDELKRKINNLKAEIEPDMDEHSKLAVQAKLALLARDRVVKIIPELSAAGAAKTATALAALSGGRSLKNFLDPLKEMLTNLDKAIPMISAVGLGIAGISTAALSSSANLFSLSASLVSIGGAGLALPGVLGGFAVGLTTTIVALKDFKKYVPEVSTAWAKIKSAISDNFWAKAQKPMKNMIDSLLPAFAAGFGKTGTAVGEFFGSLATDIGTKFRGPVKGMFADLDKSIGIFTGATGSIADIFVRLGKTGASYLPRLATYFKGLTDRFDEWLANADKDGSLKRWINNGIEALKDLGGALKAIGSIFAGLSRAMTDAGGTVLSTFRSALEGIAKVVNSPSFQAGLVGVFRGAFTAMELIEKQAGPALKQAFVTLGQTAQSVLPLAGEAIGQLASAIFKLVGSPAVQSGLKAMFTGIDAGVHALAPALSALSPLFGELGSFIGNFAKGLGPVFASALKALSPALTALLEGLEPVVTLLTGAFAEAIRGLAPGLKALAEGVVAGLKPLAKTLAPTLTKIAPAISNLMSAIGSAMAQLGPVLAPLIPQLGAIVVILLNLAAKVLPSLVPIVKALVDTLSMVLKVVTPVLQVLTKIAGVVSGVLGPALGAIGKVLAPLVAAFVGYKIAVFAVTAALKALALMQALVDVVMDANPIVLLVVALAGLAVALVVAWQKSAQFRDAVKAAFAVVLVAAQAVANFFTQTLPQAFSNGLAAVSSLVSSLMGTIVGVFSTSWGVVKNLFSQGISAVKGVVSSAAGSLGSAASTAMSTVRSSFSTAWGLVRGIFSSGISAAKSAVSGAGGALASAGTAIMAALKSAFSSAWNSIKSLFHSAASGLSSAISAAGGALASAGRAIMSTLTSAFHTSWSVVKGIFSSGIHAAIGVLSGISLSGIGSSIIHSLIGGISSAFGAVKSKLGELTSLIPSWKGPPEKDATLLTNAGHLIMDSLLKGINDKTPSLISLLHDLSAKMPKSMSTAKKDFVKAGADLVTGLINGLGSNESKIKSAVDKIQNTLNVLPKGSGLKDKLKGETVDFTATLASYDKLQDQIKAKLDALNDLKKQAADKAAEIAQTLVSSVNVTGFQADDGSQITDFSGVKTALQTAAQKMKALSDAIAKLKTLGLNSTELDQIAEAGPDAGLSIAQSIIAQGQSGVASLNKLQASLDASAKAIGTKVSQSMYKAGIDTATGLLNGLKAKEPDLIAEAKKIASQIATTIKKALDIHSPSRVMHQIGGYIGQGLLNGLESTYRATTRSLTGFANSISATDFGSPTVGLSAKVGGALAEGGQQPTVEQHRQFNYYAAPGSSLGSEEDLFAAVGRSRFAFGW